jgi:hypothetical protein
MRLLWLLMGVIEIICQWPLAWEVTEIGSFAGTCQLAAISPDEDGGVTGNEGDTHGQLGPE